uniref:Probable AP endonuclease n=1 Tax=African swine fever virus TaxID=10497 RepID=A0A6G7KUP9_ASF
MFGAFVCHRLWSDTGCTTTCITNSIAIYVPFGEQIGFPFISAQVFIAGPTKAVLYIQEDVTVVLLQMFVMHNLWVVAHGTYLHVPWSRTSAFVTHFIQQELLICKEVGITGLLLHLRAVEPVLIVEGLQKIMPVVGVVIYLETPHIKHHTYIYSTMEQIKELFLRIRNTRLQQIGLCIVTAHIWSSGVNISSYIVAGQWLRSLENIHSVFPPSHIMFHLYVAATECGSGIHRHASLFAGMFWKSYTHTIQQSGLYCFVVYITRHQCPAILERNLGSSMQLQTALSAEFTTLQSLLQ